MTNTQTQPTNERPSDEVAAKVVAKWMGWGRGCVPIKPGISRSKIVAFMEGDGDLNGETLGSVGDPRTDTDAALELLHWLVFRPDSLKLNGSIEPISDGWCAMINFPNKEAVAWYIPISGPEKNYAVVRLAAKCLGVEDGA